jgi:Uma2 family endonuclease
MRSPWPGYRPRIEEDRTATNRWPLIAGAIWLILQEIHARNKTMNIPVHKPMTLREFIAWEAQQELRYEFDGFQLIAMAGGTAAHAAIQTNIAIAIGSRLRGKPGKIYGSDLKIEINTLVPEKCRYSDGFATCTAIPNDATTVREPVVIFEVLGQSTASKDRITKNHEYQSIPTVQRYVMIEQDEIGATVFSRVEGDWIGHIMLADGILFMPEIGIDVPLVEFYEGLTLKSASEDEA